MYISHVHSRHVEKDSLTLTSQPSLEVHERRDENDVDKASLACQKIIQDFNTAYIDSVFAVSGLAEVASQTLTPNPNPNPKSNPNMTKVSSQVGDAASEIHIAEIQEMKLAIGSKILNRTRRGLSDLGERAGGTTGTKALTLSLTLTLTLKVRMVLNLWSRLRIVSRPRRKNLVF